MKPFKLTFKVNKKTEDLETIAVSLVKAEDAIRSGVHDAHESMMAKDVDKLLKLARLLQYTRLSMECDLISALAREGRFNDPWELTTQAMKKRGLLQ